jgi:hypothetical protein
MHPHPDDEYKEDKGENKNARKQASIHAHTPVCPPPMSELLTMDMLCKQLYKLVYISE